MSTFSKIALGAVACASFSPIALAQQSLKTIDYAPTQPVVISQPIAPVVSTVPQPILPTVSSSTLAPVALPTVTTIPQPAVSNIVPVAPAVVSSACTGVISIKTASYCSPQQLAQSVTIPTTSITQTPVITTQPISTITTPTTISAQAPVITRSPTLVPQNITPVAPITTTITPVPETAAAIEPIRGPETISGPRFFFGVEGGASTPSFTGRLPNLTFLTRSGGVVTVLADNQSADWDATGPFEIGYQAGGRFGVMLDSGLYGSIDGLYRFAEYTNSWSTGSDATLDRQRFETKVNTVAAFLTGGFSLNTGSLIRPFGEVSVGYALNTASGNYHRLQGTTPTDTFIVAYPESEAAGLAYGASLGAGFMLTSDLEARIGYRYRNLGPASTERETIANTILDLGTIEAHELYVGVNYLF